MNQDRIYVSEKDAFFLLADGIGGHPAGEVAAQAAVDSVASSLYKGINLRDAVRMAHLEILQRGREDAGRKGMGTTLVGLVIHGHNYEVAWVGDSRAYLINQTIAPLTTDHNLAEALLAQHVISPEVARELPGRNRLTRALGIAKYENLEVSLVDGVLTQGDVLLLCSDGLHSLVNDDQILSAFEMGEGLQSAADRLVQSALAAGGTDNVSIIAVSL